MPNPNLSRLAQHITPRWLKPALVGLAGLMASCAFAATITVNSTADTAANDGVCTLREAITAANTDTPSGAMAGECAAGSGTDTITFNIAGAGVKTITLASALPDLTTNIWINGLSQPGSSANSNGAGLGSNAVLLIEIDASNIGNNPALDITGATASGSIIEGLALGRTTTGNGAAEAGISISTQANNVHIRGNFIGTDASGTLNRRFAPRAIFVRNVIGATLGSTQATLTPAYLNLASTEFGVSGAPHTGLTIRGNLIGTTRTGLLAIPGTKPGRGINLDNVGAGSVVADNVLSNTNQEAVAVQRSTGVTFENNLIGLGVNGTTAIPNTGSGLLFNDNVNVSNSVQNNIQVRDNKISNNGLGGVRISRSTNTTNTVRGIFLSRNLINNNIGMEIDLFNGATSDGPTPNDSNDSDTGANDLQNYPVLSPARGNGTQVQVPYNFQSVPNSSFTLEFFQASACDASAQGGAEVYLGSVAVTTAADGTASGAGLFNSTLNSGVATATATHPVSGTSEFSNCTPLVAGVLFNPLSLTTSGAGTGTISNNSALSCTTSCSQYFSPNTTFNITTVPNAGSAFVGWSGACTGTGACSVTMDAARAVNAQFEPTQSTNVTLTVTKTGGGAGSITGGTINCGATCSASVPLNTVITLTATPVSGNSFAGWSGGGCIGVGTCTVTMDIAKTVNAQFDLSAAANFTLTVTKSGTGTGSVAIGSSIVCGSVCSLTLVANSTITLTATPVAGSSFVGWGGGGCSGTAPCTVTFDASKTVNAQFNLAPVVNYTLTVTKSGTGTGSVSGGAINCGATCAATVVANTVITLTATPVAGSSFIGWSGGGCSGTSTCAVTVDAAKTVNAQFDLVPPVTFALTVTKSGTGTGSVSGGAINCGATCGATVAANTVITLTATPVAGSIFIGWSGGGCSGTSTCAVTVDAAKTVNAQFDLIPPGNFTLTVTKSGTGTGSVSGGAVNCGATCSATVAANTVITLTATPVAGSSFVGWSGGGCSGTSTCAVTTDAAKTVNAQFDLIPAATFNLAITFVGGGQGVVSGGSINCPAICTATAAANTVITLTATPAAGFVFVGWSGAGCSGTSTCTVTMDSAKAVIAQFALALIAQPLTPQTVPTLQTQLLLLMMLLLMGYGCFRHVHLTRNNASGK